MRRHRFTPALRKESGSGEFGRFGEPRPAIRFGAWAVHRNVEENPNKVRTDKIKHGWYVSHECGLRICGQDFSLWDAVEIASALQEAEIDKQMGALGMLDPASPRPQSPAVEAIGRTIADLISDIVNR